MPETGKQARRNVLVTGGSRGLGLAIACRLAAAGYGVVAVARKMSDQLTAAMQKTAKSRAGTFDFVAFDLADTQAIPKLARNVRKEFGAVYGLVNNAALGTDGLLAN